MYYRIHEPYNREELLDPHTPGIVLPEVKHEVEPLENAQFYVEFWHHADLDDAPTDPHA
ncbi:MAG TPA: DUF1971 domain-containing protein [Stenomitos sp.]